MTEAEFKEPVKKEKQMEYNRIFVGEVMVEKKGGKGKERKRERECVGERNSTF